MRICEIRFVCAMSTPQERREYLNGVEKKRGKVAADALRLAVKDQWEKGRRL